MQKKYDSPEFERDLAELCEGLVYISETDADVRPIFGKPLRESSVEGYIEALDIETVKPVEVIDAEEFYSVNKKQRLARNAGT